MTTTRGQGQVHVYHGDGKGKTTCGMGLCVRAAGRGKRVLIYQFLKDNSSGEIASLANIPNITRIPGNDTMKFTFQMTPDELEIEQKRNAFILTKIAAIADQYDLLFLDEAVYAMDLNLLSERQVLTFLNTRADHLEVVLTGRNPSQKLLEAADYVTEMVKRKHPFDQGMESREGIEF